MRFGGEAGGDCDIAVEEQEKIFQSRDLISPASAEGGLRLRYRRRSVPPISVAKNDIYPLQNPFKIFAQDTNKRVDCLFIRFPG